jgi:ATP-dependent Clp protease adaptor protein ClpS
LPHKTQDIAGVTQKPPNKPEFDTDVAIGEAPETKKPRRYKVIFHNDDYTSQEFVVEVLRVHFRKTDMDARHIMLTVHHKGRAVAGVYPRDVAETKIELVTELAREHGMPLLVTSEPEE